MKINRIGEQFISNEGYEVIIVEYNNTNDVWVQFQDQHKAKVHTTYQNCRKGEVGNPYHRSVYGVGYLGVGKYKSRIDGKYTKEYLEWHSMLTRCYSEKYQNKYSTYKDALVNEYFHNFQNYCKWREDNYYEIEGEQMCLDKDILIKDNKEYSFNTMVFVPERINKLFIKRDALRGDCPIGVSYHKASGKYMAKCNTLFNRKYLGLHNTPEEAFQAYKQFKETYIKQIADEYKDKIPQRLYDAMYNWTVEIDD